DAHEWTRDARAQAECAGGLGDTAEHRPHERALSLSIDPRVVVVGDNGEIEAGALGLTGELHQVGGSVFFGAQPVAELHRAPCGTGYAKGGRYDGFEVLRALAA